MSDNDRPEESAADTKQAAGDELTRAERQGLALLALFIISLLLALVVFGVFLQDDEKETETPEAEPTQLHIDTVYPQFMESGENDTYEFAMIMLLTNEGDTPANNVRIVIAGIDKIDKITYDKQSASGIDIPAKENQSIEVAIRLTVPVVDYYKMFVMLFVDDKLELKGDLIVVPGGGTSKRDFQVTYNRNTEDAYRGLSPVMVDEDAGKSSQARFMLGVFGFLLFIEIIVVLALIRWDALPSAFRKLTNRS